MADRLSAQTSLFPSNTVTLPASLVGVCDTAETTICACPAKSAMTAPLTTLMKARDEVVAAFWCDLVWALSYVIALVALTSSIGIIGAGVAMFVACVAQLVTAVGLSRLPRSERVSASALLQTVVAVALALAPIAVVSQYWALSPGANFAVKVGLALPALLLFRWLMSLRSVFSTDERSRLVAVLSQRGLKPLAVVFK